MNNSNFQEELLKELKIFISPVISIANDDEVLIRFFKSIGWDLDKVLPGTSLSDFITNLSGLENIVTTIEGYIDTPPETIADFIGILTDLPGILEPIIGISNTISQLPTSNTSLQGVSVSDIEELPKDIIEGIILYYLVNRVPKIFYFFQLLGILRIEHKGKIENSSTESIRTPRLLHRFRFDKIPLLFSDPATYFDELYGLDFTNENTIGESSHTLFYNISLFLATFNINVAQGREGLDKLPNLTAIQEKEMASFSIEKIFELYNSSASTQYLTLGALFRLLSQTEQGPGLRIEPYGEIDLNFIFDKWELGIELDAGIGIVDIVQSGFQIHPPGTSGNLIPAFRAGLKLTKLSEDDLGGQAMLIGSTTGTRFEIAKIGLGGFLELQNANEKDFGFRLELEEAAFVIQGGDGDGFLSKILPDEGLRLAFDMGLEWTNKKGFKFTFGISAGTALELVIPLNQTLFNVIDFKDVRFRLAGEEGNKGMAVAIGGTVGVSIGPFKAMIENMGVKAIFNLPESGGGNLGPLDLDFGFKPPSGIAMSIDAGGFKGGGFLSINPPRYVGALQLTFASGFNITAICIITTELPGGEEGFSLLVVITVEFSPAIQVGMGIAITGFGGMLGLHRSIDTSALRTGLKTGMLESILFPQDILGNPDKVISDLDSAFPIEKDHFVFGPMLKATWGDKSFVNISFGLMIELPDPVIILPGLIGISLFDSNESEDGGEESIKVLNINIAFIGIIDIPAKMISIDASIYNSKILVMTIEGDMAFRLTWGDNPIFVLSMGGFHPAFTPPPLDLDKMKRLSIIILNDENFKLYAESYMAITSNTFQFGAAIVFYAKLGPFEVDCFVGLDTIFFFNPFSMEVGIEMRGQISWDGTPLLSLIIAANLSGPSPWRIYGRVKIVIAEIIDFEFNFDEEFGNQIPETIPTIELRPILREELLNTENWMPVSEIGQNDLVTLGKGPEDKYLIRPMGSLKISQNKIPLELKMEKYGTDAISGSDRFEISQVKINGVVFETKDIEDLFAPVEYQKIEDNTEAVEAEAYEKYKSGVQVSSKLQAGAKKTRRRERELILVDNKVEQLTVNENGTAVSDQVHTEHSLQRFAASTRSTTREHGVVYDSPLARQMELKTNTISKSDLSVKSPTAKALKKKGIKVLQQKYKIVSGIDLSPINDQVYGYAEAKIVLKAEIAKDPRLVNILKIVPIKQVVNSSIATATTTLTSEI